MQPRWNFDLIVVNAIAVTMAAAATPSVFTVAAPAGECLASTAGGDTGGKATAGPTVASDPEEITAPLYRQEGVQRKARSLLELSLLPSRDLRVTASEKTTATPSATG